MYEGAHELATKTITAAIKIDTFFILIEVLCFDYMTKVESLPGLIPTYFCP
jgi:hypothetical protein